MCQSKCAHARNGRNEKQENEKQITVTAVPFWRINFQLQLLSCLRRRINVGLQLPSGPLQELKNVILFLREWYVLSRCFRKFEISVHTFLCMTFPAKKILFLLQVSLKLLSVVFLWLPQKS